MLADRNVAATIAVRDIGVARKFYGETLGLKEVDTGSGMKNVCVFSSGDSTILIYISEHAGTNRATSATWNVGEELEEIVRKLRGARIEFEHYDFPGSTREGDIHVFGEIRNAWFRDPDGNILSLVNG
jgi:catechol 2,3-dioxygenase-like lactoylglutathione lyase family enzyme